MRRTQFGILVLMAIAVLGAGLAYALHHVSRVIVVRVATGPADGFGARFATSLVHLIALEHPRVRVQVTNTASDEDALAALGAGQADLAVARSDAGPVGQTIAVVRHDAGLFVVPHGHKADSVAGLRGASIGIVGMLGGDMRLFDSVRQEYGLPAKPEPVQLAPSEVAEAFRTKKIEALFVVAAVGGKTLSQALAGARSAGGGGTPRLIAVDEAAAIVKHSHVLEEVDLPKGVLQGAPPLPDDDTSTIGVSTRVFATERLPNAAAAELTRILLTDKPRVAAMMPPTAVVEPPETDKLNASLPVHPGAAAYLTGNQPTLSDQAQNALYWFGIVGSLLASATAAIAALVRRFRPARQEAMMRLLDLWVAARNTDDLASLAAIEKDVDSLVQEAVRRQASGKRDEINPNFPLVVSQMRHALSRRRDELSGMGGISHPNAPG